MEMGQRIKNIMINRENTIISKHLFTYQMSVTPCSSHVRIDPHKYAAAPRIRAS